MIINYWYSDHINHYVKQIFQILNKVKVTDNKNLINNKYVIYHIIENIKDRCNN